MTNTDAWFAPSAIAVYEVKARASTWVFLELRDAGGLCGLAEVTCPDSAAAASMAARLTNRLRGERVRSDSDLVQRLPLNPEALQKDIVLATAYSGVRSAISDALARRSGLPLCKYLLLTGGAAEAKPADRVSLYANINRALLQGPQRQDRAVMAGTSPVRATSSSPADRTPEGFAALARQAADVGFEAFKCAPFDECRAPFKTQGMPPEAEHGLERVRAVKDAIGPGSRLFVDCHSRFDLDSALALEPALRAAGAAWYEEPLDPITRSEDMRRVRDASRLPMAGAEHGYGLATFKGMVESGVLDIVMPDAKHCGGVSEAFRAGLEIESASPGSVSMHCPSGPVSLLTSVHVSAAFIAAADSGAAAMPLEHAVFEVEWRSEALWPRERIEKGDLVLPVGPGLGAELDYSVVLARGRKWSP